VQHDLRVGDAPLRNDSTGARSTEARGTTMDYGDGALAAVPGLSRTPMTAGAPRHCLAQRGPRTAETRLTKKDAADCCYTLTIHHARQRRR
jgi:hypothetical protein